MEPEVALAILFATIHSLLEKKRGERDMIKFINEETGKSSVTILDDGTLTLDGGATLKVDGKEVTEAEVRKALEDAKKEE